MFLTHKNGVSFYRFKSLESFPEIWHGIFTRRFGCSTGPFKSLNVGFGLGDKASCVKENRRVIAPGRDYRSQLQGLPGNTNTGFRP